MKRNTMKKGLLFLVLVCCLGFGVSQMQSTPAQAAKKTSTKKKTVKKKSLTKAKITLSKKTYTYTGKAKKPSVTVKYGKKKLKKNKDYTVKYTSNKKAGTAKVTVTAKSGKAKLYKGKKTAKYTIKKAASGIALDRSEYTAVEGDGAFNIVAKPTKGAGKITYSCATTNVIKVTSAGQVTVVKQGAATVNMTLAETANYYGASTSVKVTVSKKKITVDSASGIQNFDYATQVKAAQKEYASSSSTVIKKLTDYTYTIITKYAIPGLAPTADDDLTKGYIQCNNLCPQGFYFAGDYLLTTAYCMDDIHNSCIFIYNKNSGAYLRTIVLNQKSHVGGIAYDGENVWICHAGEKALECISYKELKNYATGKQGIVKRTTVTLKALNTKPSAVTYNEADGRIWVAEYVSLPNYKKGDIPYMAAYQYEDGELVPAYDMTYDKEPEEDYLSITTKDSTIIKGDKGDEDKTVVSGAAVQTISEEKEIQTKEDKDYRLEAGDLITNINGYTITGKDSLKEALKDFGDQGGQRVAITIERKVKATKVTEEDTYVTIEGWIVLGEYGEKVYLDEIEIPNRVQGLCFNGDGSRLILSRSVGRNTTKASYVSELVVYDWKKFDRTKPELVVEVPPMVEQVNYDSQSRELYMLFESAATTYLEGTDGAGNSMSPIDKLISLKIIL